MSYFVALNLGQLKICGDLYHVAAQQGYIHVTDLHARNMVNGGVTIANFFKTTQKREVKILVICLSDLAAMRLEEKRS